MCPETGPSTQRCGASSALQFDLRTIFLKAKERDILQNPFRIYMQSPLFCALHLAVPLLQPEGGRLATDWGCKGQRLPTAEKWAFASCSEVPIWRPRKLMYPIRMFCHRFQSHKRTWTLLFHSLPASAYGCNVRQRWMLWGSADELRLYGFHWPVWHSMSHASQGQLSGNFFFERIVL